MLGSNACLIINTVLGVVSNTGADIKTMKSRMENDEEHKLLKWLTPVDYGPQQSDFIKRRQEGTGLWLLRTDEFAIWLEQRNKTLFCSGIPGAGETILSSVIVDHLCSKYRTDTHVGIAYIYCNFQQQQQQTPEDLLLSLLKQLLQKRSPIPESIRTLHERHRREHTRPSRTEILEALKSVGAEYTRVLIIVDALDECGVSDGERREFVSAIFNLQRKTEANLFVTSRFNDAIVRLFHSALSLQIRANEEDVLSYLDRQMSFMQCDILEDDLRDRIKREVVRAADGIYANYSTKH